MFYNGPKPTPRYRSYSEANQVMEQLRKAFYTIKQQYKPEEAEKAITQLKNQFADQIKYWNGEKEAAQKAIQEKLDKAKPKARTRSLTGEDVAVLSYKANVLKGRFMQASSSEDFDALKNEILTSDDEQLKQAFLDHIHEYSELQVKETGAFRRLLNDTQKSLTETFMTDEEKEYRTVQEEALRERSALNSKFFALEDNLKELHTELNKGTWGGQLDGAHTGEGAVINQSDSLWS